MARQKRPIRPEIYEEWDKTAFCPFHEARQVSADRAGKLYDKWFVAGQWRANIHEASMIVGVYSGKLVIAGTDAGLPAVEQWHSQAEAVLESFFQHPDFSDAEPSDIGHHVACLIALKVARGADEEALALFEQRKPKGDPGYFPAELRNFLLAILDFVDPNAAPSVAWQELMKWVLANRKSPLFPRKYLKAKTFGEMRAMELAEAEKQRKRMATDSAAQ